MKYGEKIIEEISSIFYTYANIIVHKRRLFKICWDTWILIKIFNNNALSIFADMVSSVSSEKIYWSNSLCNIVNVYEDKDSEKADKV